MSETTGTTQSRTPALDLKAAEKELDVLSKQTKTAYQAWRAAHDRQADKAEEIRALRRQIREGVAK